MGRKLKSISDRLDAIASERRNFHLREEVVAGNTEARVLDWRLTTSLVNESEMIGREKDKEELVNKLLACSEVLSVYAICGMGGLGKTTLAQLVYNDERVKCHFDLRIWVCVSDAFDSRRLVRAIVEYVDACPPHYQELDPLQRLLQEKLSGKKFLLILDDVWNEDNGKWDGLKNTIRCGVTGCVVVVTTRNEKIALMMATTPTYCIQRLSDEDSWSLFAQRAFGPRNKDVLSDLETIGRDIVVKCGGLPLAIKALGSLLRLKRKQSEWLSVKESELWDVFDEGSTDVLPALRLSYKYLPPHMKQCLAFCSVFPKDYKMEKDMLIGHWMANGFISCQRQMDLYDKGQEIFDELVWRSFFQDVVEDSWGNLTCKMHDLIHDLAQSAAFEECTIIGPSKMLEVPKRVRHLTIDESPFQSFLDSNKHFQSQSLHSCFVSHDYHRLPSHSSASYLTRQKHLRALFLFGLRLENFPLSIDRLKHLRFLDFSY